MAQKHAISDVPALRELFFTLYRRFGSLHREQICCDWVTVSQCYAMQILLGEGEMTAGELGERLGIDASTVTRGVDVLEKRGAIERRRAELGDRRRVLLRLTPDGEELTRRINDQANTTFERLLDRLGPKERDELVRSLGTFSRLLDELATGCGPCEIGEK